ncbi:MAG: LytTR family transcriptional regulator [Lactobacillaceae bacterium]|jgi:DNA-binding LytR/AlgR family response regulator|nr:LytTR family transcriptional regulator [Lactobacillaceae bacterium]
MDLLGINLSENKLYSNIDNWKKTNVDSASVTDSIDFFVEVGEKLPKVELVVFASSFYQISRYHVKLKDLIPRLVVVSDNQFLASSLLNAHLAVKSFYFILGPDEVENSKQLDRFLNIKTDNPISINLDNLIYIETVPQKHQSKIFVQDNSFIVKQTLSQIEKDNYESLMRISSSFLVNERQLKKINTVLGVVELRNGLQLPFSRPHKKKIEHFFATKSDNTETKVAM